MDDTETLAKLKVESVDIAFQEQAFIRVAEDKPEFHWLIDERGCRGKLIIEH